MILNGRMDRLSTKQNGKQFLHFRTSCGKCSDLSDCCINLYSFFCIYIFFGMFHKCNVRDCASSAKSVVIVLMIIVMCWKNYEGYCT